MATDESQSLGVLWERVDGLLRTVKEQHVETLRRLDELNHAHDQAVKRNETYIPRETFEQKIDSVQRATDAQTSEVERQIERLRQLMDQRNDDAGKEINRRISEVHVHIDGIKKLLYMGVGIVLALQALLWVFVMIMEKYGST